jgi:parallel beta-helix repeat protein
VHEKGKSINSMRFYCKQNVAIRRKKMKKGKMEVRVIDLKIMVVLVALLVTAMSSGLASAMECMDCHFGDSSPTVKDHSQTNDTVPVDGIDQEAGATIYVPDHYTTIQEAIDAALNGDEIIVRDGIYVENINFLGKAITVRSENGASLTTIYGVEMEVPTAVVTFSTNEGAASVFDGFTVTGGIGGFGGGISCINSWPTISNCIITGNQTALTGFGGGIFVWYSHIVENATITNCVITNNMADDTGGGIYIGGTSPNITNCTISDNSSNNGGGGIRSSEAASPTAVNTILWLNTPDEISVRADSSIDITYSDIQGGWTGLGNINQDPVFVGGDDYHLTAGSPCIDAGTSEGAPGYDIDGDVRPVGSGVDIGADEYSCGDGYCAGAANGEDCDTCPADCIGAQGGTCDACFKGICDGSCNPRKEGLDCADCASSYCCGDYICEGDEDTYNCAVDCGAPPFCGDSNCDPGEDKCNCSVDCGPPDLIETNCADGIDNDCDDLTDCDDIDCDCACLPLGSSCTSDGECCSEKCAGKPGSKICR